VVFSEVLRTRANCSSAGARAPRKWSGRRSTGPTPGRPLVGAAERDEPRTAPPAGGRTTQARKVLAPVYGRFTEGFGTADLMTAKALLDTLR